VQLDAEQARAAELLIELLDAGEFSPPHLADAVAASNAQSVVRELEASGRLVRITADLAMTAQQLDRAHELLYAAFVEEGPLTAARARDVLDTTRKYVLPLMATLDQRGCTRRQGDLRIVMDPTHHQAAPTRRRGANSVLE
jgi:selenocysteine-specific elongation factor